MLDANMKFYESLGRVTQEYLTAVTQAMVPLPLSFKIPTPDPSTRGSSPSTPAPVAQSSGPVLAIEGADGSTAQAAFVVSSGLSRAVTAPVMVSALKDAQGDEVRPAIRVVPGALTLGPGEKAVVQLQVAIDETLQAGVAYYGVITVPELSSEQIPIVVRRMESAARQPNGTSRAARSRKRSTARKR